MNLTDVYSNILGIYFHQDKLYYKTPEEIIIYGKQGRIKFQKSKLCFFDDYLVVQKHGVIDVFNVNLEKLYSIRDINIVKGRFGFSYVDERYLIWGKSLEDPFNLKYYRYNGDSISEFLETRKKIICVNHSDIIEISEDKYPSRIARKNVLENDTIWEYRCKEGSYILYVQTSLVNQDGHIYFFEYSQGYACVLKKMNWDTGEVMDEVSAKGGPCFDVESDRTLFMNRTNNEEEICGMDYHIADLRAMSCAAKQVYHVDLFGKSIATKDTVAWSENIIFFSNCRYGIGNNRVPANFACLNTESNEIIFTQDLPNKDNADIYKMEIADNKLFVYNTINELYVYDVADILND